MYKTHRTEGSVVHTHTGGAKGMEEGHANSGGLGAINRGQQELECELRAAKYGTEGSETYCARGRCASRSAPLLGPPP